MKIHHNARNSVSVNWKRIFPDFEFYSNDKKETGILVHKKLQHKEIDDLSYRMGKNQWSTWVMISNSAGKNVAISSYYRSPSSNGDTNNMNKEMNEIRQKYLIESFIVCGDFNAYSGIWDARFNGRHDKNTENVIKFMDSNKFVCINDPINLHMLDNEIGVVMELWIFLGIILLILHLYHKI